MIVVLDTNVIISSVLSLKGPPAKLIQRWEADEFEVAISPPLLEELERALTYEQVKKYFKKSQEKIDALVERFRTVATVVDPQVVLDVVPDDPDDNRVLECAVTANASYIVTGNKHLLDLKEYKGIVVLKPAAFLTLLELGDG